MIVVFVFVFSTRCGWPDWIGHVFAGLPDPAIQWILEQRQYESVDAHARISRLYMAFVRWGCLIYCLDSGGDVFLEDWQGHVFVY